jgi:hypothetical protein
LRLLRTRGMNDICSPRQFDSSGQQLAGEAQPVYQVAHAACHRGRGERPQRLPEVGTAWVKADPDHRTCRRPGQPLSWLSESPHYEPGPGAQVIPERGQATSYATVTAWPPKRSLSRWVHAPEWPPGGYRSVPARAPACRHRKPLTSADSRRRRPLGLVPRRTRPRARPEARPRPRKPKARRRDGPRRRMGLSLVTKPANTSDAEHRWDTLRNAV